MKNDPYKPEQLSPEQVRDLYSERRYADIVRAKYEGRLDDYLASVGEALTTPVDLDTQEQ